MSLTNFKEFDKLFKKIPKDRLKNVHFIPLRTGSKVPVGNWKGITHLTYYQCKDYMKTGGNIAVAAIPGGIMFLDIDTFEGKLKVSEDILSQIPETFTVKTRSGGLHFYFLNCSIWDNQKFMINNEEVGELRTNWQYVVSPGSWVEPATYTVLADIPIVKFEGDITKYFRSCEQVKDLSPKGKKEPPTIGKQGKPLQKETQILMQEKHGTDERRKQILEALNRRT